MRLSTREDLDLPVEIAFREVANPDYIERQMLRAGIRVVRAGDVERPGLGMEWTTQFEWSGMVRKAEIAIVGWTPPEQARVSGKSGSVEADLMAEFTALSKSATRLRVTLDLKAHSFRERLLLHGLRVKKARLERRFSDLVARFATEAERRGVYA